MNNCAKCGEEFFPFQNMSLLQDENCYKCAIEIMAGIAAQRAAKQQNFHESFSQFNQASQQRQSHRRFFTEPTPPPRRETPQAQVTLDLDMIRRLIRLCHPDKHANSESANIATTFLLSHRK